MPYMRFGLRGLSPSYPTVYLRNDVVNIDARKRVKFRRNKNIHVKQRHNNAHRPHLYIGFVFEIKIQQPARCSDYFLPVMLHFDELKIES